jgi:hypothetical protein
MYCTKEYLLLSGIELDAPAMFSEVPCYLVMRWLDNYKDGWWAFAKQHNFFAVYIAVLAGGLMT